MDDEAAIGAVLTPPQLRRFREVCQVDGEITANFDGWTKLALLTDDRVFLFPRNHALIARQERECAVYAVVDHAGVPHLRGRWADLHIYAYPFFAVSRLAGATSRDAWNGAAHDLIADLGETMASCHNIALDQVPHILRTHWGDDTFPTADPLPDAMTSHSFFGWMGGPEGLAARAGELLNVSPPTRWTQAVSNADAMAAVLTHDDLQQDQLLIEDGRLSGILDWELSMVTSPLADFTFSEWSSDLLDTEPSYGDFRRWMWTAYAKERAADLPSPEDIHIALTLFDITMLSADPPSYYWQHTQEWRRARLDAALKSLSAS